MQYSKSVRTQYGYTFIEVAIVLVIFGIFSTMGINLLNTASAAQKQKVAIANLNQAQIALRLFAIKNFRLPCPDTNRDGYEDPACHSQTGSLPYITLGLEQLSPEQADDNRIEYGVYRGDQDLTEKIKTDNSRNIFIQRLMNINQINRKGNTSKNHPFIPNYSEGIVGCGSNDKAGIFNPAFVVMLKIDENLIRPTINQNCFFTDPLLYPAELISVTAPELIGWIGAKK